MRGKEGREGKDMRQRRWRAKESFVEIMGCNLEALGARRRQYRTLLQNKGE